MNTSIVHSSEGLSPVPAAEALRAAWQRCPWGMALVDAGGKVCAVTPAFAQITAVEVDALVGLSESALHALLSTLAHEHRRLEVATAPVVAIHYLREITGQAHDAKRLSRVAQELREPLASAYGFAELLQTQNYDEPTRRDLTTTLLEQLELMSNIINEQLDLRRDSL